MIWIWRGIIIVLLLAEILSRKATALCFVLGAIISAVLTKFTGDYLTQVGVFLIAGILLAILIRPFILILYKKIFNKVNKYISSSKLNKRKENKKK